MPILLIGFVGGLWARSEFDNGGLGLVQLAMIGGGGLAAYTVYKKVVA